MSHLIKMHSKHVFQSECDQMHRFSLVVNDLQASETVAHKTSVLTFINAIINCTPEITERIRIRNEFIGEAFFILYFIFPS